MRKEARDAFEALRVWRVVALREGVVGDTGVMIGAGTDEGDPKEEAEVGDHGVAPGESGTARDPGEREYGRWISEGRRLVESVSDG